MDIEEAVNAVMAISPRMVIQMHQAPNDPNTFGNEVVLKSSTKVIIPNVGEKVIV